MTEVPGTDFCEIVLILNKQEKKTKQKTKEEQNGKIDQKREVPKMQP